LVTRTILSADDLLAILTINITGDPGVGSDLLWRLILLRLERYLCGVGHPPGTQNILPDPPSAEEEAVLPAELRPYLFLKALTNLRLIPVGAPFDLTVRAISFFLATFDTTHPFCFQLEVRAYTHVGRMSTEPCLKVATCARSASIELNGPSFFERVLSEKGGNSRFEQWFHAALIGQVRMNGFNTI
jgi:hypothetical protein